VLAQPLFVARGPGRVQGLDDRGGHALVEHAAQELLAGGEPGRAVEHLDPGAQRAQQSGVAGGAGSAGQHGDAQAAPGHRGHHCHVGERDAGLLRDVRQLSFGARGGRVQVGPQDFLAPALLSPAFLGQGGQGGPERVHRGLRAVDAQHQVRALCRLGFAGGVEDGF